MKNSVRQIVSAAKSFVRPLKSLEPARDLYLVHGKSQIPLAEVSEENLQAYDNRDWRKHFSNQLQGKGLEIGPLHRPMCRHPGMQIDYIDRCTVTELREHYPELNGLDLVEPNIIGDAETLETVPDKSYDFVIAAHVIEHMRNPLAALKHWCRVTRPGGMVYLIVPDKRVTFDKHRVRTSIPHMILDYLRPSAERDFEHYLDYAIHVHEKSEQEAIEEADRLLKTDYSIHYHVFLPSDIINLLAWFSVNVTKIRTIEGPCMAPESDEFHFLIEVA